MELYSCAARLSFRNRGHRKLMKLKVLKLPLQNPFILAVFIAFAALVLSSAQAQAPSATRALGTVKSVGANSIVLTADAGAEVTANVDANTKILRISPGEKDLKNAETISFSDLQVGDRLLIRGSSSDAGKTLQAASVIAMKQADIARKNAREREAWQRNGAGGLVKSIDPAAGAIVIATNASGPNRDVTIHVTPKTILRRYAPDSVKFDDAKPAPLTDIKPGDQLRARGTRNPEGTELAADEIVSGSFRNVSGTIVSVDPAGVLTVHDLATKQDVQVHVTPQTQMRKLPLPLAQRIAVRLKGESPANGSQGAPQHAGPPNRAETPSGDANAANGSARASGGDFQQIISRLPASSLSGIQKGEAVMLVATAGSQPAGVTAITLLSGVEPILEASPKRGQDMILSPWSLGGGGAEAAAGVDNP